MQEETHYCFCCMEPFQVVMPPKGHESNNPEGCPVCGFFRCPHCGKCACDLQPGEKRVLEAFWQTHCSASCGKRRR